MCEVAKGGQVTKNYLKDVSSVTSEELWPWYPYCITMTTLFTKLLRHKLHHYLHFWNYSAYIRHLYRPYLYMYGYCRRMSNWSIHYQRMVNSSHKSLWSNTSMEFTVLVIAWATTTDVSKTYVTIIYIHIPTWLKKDSQ